MPTASMAFSNRSRNSSRCEISVPSASAARFARWFIHWVVCCRIVDRIRRRAVGGRGRRLRMRRRLVSHASPAWLVCRSNSSAFTSRSSCSLELPRHEARAPHPIADLARNFGKPLRTQHDECYGRSEQNLRKSEIKHAASGIRLGGRLDLRLAAVVPVEATPVSKSASFSCFSCFTFSSDSPSFMACLKPLTAAPRSEPIAAQTLGAEYHQGDRQNHQ